jgi:hypothetical protein
MLMTSRKPIDRKSQESKPTNRFGHLCVHISTSVLLLTLVFFAPGKGQVTYYVSSDGNDTNDGRSTSTPWKTISKVDAVALSPGDEVLFRSGDTFFGQLDVNNSGSAGAPIRLGSYASGATKPVVSGAIRLTNWVPYSGSIYMTQAPQIVKNLWCNGQQMILARYPNTGFLAADGTDGSTWLSTQEIDRPSGYWVGTTVHVRATYFSYESRPISSHSGGTIYFSRGTDLSFASGWGFYLDGKLEELDAPVEWYCDPATKNVYFWSPTGADPNTLTIDGSTLDYGVNCNSSNVTVEGLRFEYQAKAGLRFGGNTGNNRIAANELFGCGVSGILVDGETYDYTISGNTLTNINGCGVNFYFVNTHRTAISDNHVSSIGMIPGYGLSGVNGMSGIVACGTNNLIARNRVDSTGYNGIRSDGSYSTIENNVVTNAMMRLADGGGIYAYSELPSTTYGQIWRNNIIADVAGNIEGTPGNGDKVANGLYLDHANHDMLIQGNTVIRAASAGLFMQFNDYNNVVRGNAFYDCGANPGGVCLLIVQDASKSYGNNRVVKNVFFSLDQKPRSLVLIQGPTYLSAGVFDSNYYCSPSQGLAVATLAYGQGWDWRDYTLDQWKEFSNQDQHSKNLYAALTPFVVTDSSASEAVTNGTFDSDISGWAQWGGNISLRHVPDAGLDGGSLQTTLATGSIPDAAAAISIPGVKQGQWYQLRFSVRGTGTSVVWAGIRKFHEPWDLASNALACPVGTQRTEYTFFMQAKTTDANVRLEFRCYVPGAVFYLDNVSLREVTGSLLTTGDQAPIFTNSSATTQTIQLGADAYRDLDGNLVPASLSLAPFSSKVLVRNNSSPSKNTGVKGKDSGHLEWDFRLFQNYPNPFNPSTRIRYVLPKNSRVSLDIFDVAGQKVKTLVDEVQEAGPHEAILLATNLATGAYFCRLLAGGFSATRKLLVIK